MKTTRRSFLKYLGGLAACAVAIPSFLKPKKIESIPVPKSYPLFINPSYTDNEAWYLPEGDTAWFLPEKLPISCNNRDILDGELVCMNVDGEICTRDIMFDSEIYGIAVGDSVNRKVNVFRGI